VGRVAARYEPARSLYRRAGIRGSYPTAAKGMEWNTKIAEVLGEVWAGNVSPDEMCDMAAEAANQVYKPQSKSLLHEAGHTLTRPRTVHREKTRC